MQITHIPVHPNFLLTWLSSSPIFTWYSTHQQYLLSMSSPNLFMPIYTCYVCIDEALLDYADFWYRVVWKPWIYLKCHHAFTNAPFPSREEDGGNQLHKPLPPHDPPCYCVRPQMFPLLKQMLKRAHTAARTENSCGRDLQMGWAGLGAIGAIKVLACHNFPLDVKAAVHIQVGNPCLGV